MDKIFELAMLILFGISWPVSLYKSYTSRAIGSKSLFFLFAIILGYASGIAMKFSGGRLTDLATPFYFINMIMVMCDVVLYFRNKKIENAKKNKGENL